MTIWQWRVLMAVIKIILVILENTNIKVKAGDLNLLIEAKNRYDLEDYKE